MDTTKIKSIHLDYFPEFHATYRLPTIILPRKIMKIYYRNLSVIHLLKEQDIKKTLTHNLIKHKKIYFQNIYYKTKCMDVI